MASIYYQVICINDNELIADRMSLENALLLTGLLFQKCDTIPDLKYAIVRISDETEDTNV